MGEKRKIRFVANPFSGLNKKRNLGHKIEQHLDHSLFDFELEYTKAAGHAVELSREAARLGYYMVVAAGGDGSVNEIAEGLIGSNTILGILPCGSGNGFATHLGIDRNLGRAIRLLNDGKVVEVDTCLMDEKPFVNLAGVGFDALIAYKIKGSKLRGIIGYLKHALGEALSYEMQDFDILIDEKKIKRSCLVVEVANASMYGYGFAIAPCAKLDDGKLDVVIIKKAPKWRYVLEGWRLINNSLHESSLSECYSAREVTIFPSYPTAVHVDGEGYLVNQGPINFKVNPSSLKVLCPKSYIA